MYIIRIIVCTHVYDIGIIPRGVVALIYPLKIFLSSERNGLLSESTKMSSHTSQGTVLYYCITLRPRSPLPLSATLTEEEAATIIQAHYRGYRIRCTDPHVVEFRKWQRRLAEERMAVLKIQKWWRNVMSSNDKLSHENEKQKSIM